MAGFSKNSKKVFSGEIFSVYQWQQKMYDESFSVFEGVERKATVDIIATIGDKIITLNQEQPTKPLFPSLPGGSIEKGEKPRQAVSRELMEETGYTPAKIIKFKHFNGMPKIIFPQTIYIARDCHKAGPQNLDNGEKISISFKTYDQFLQLCRNERFTAALGLRFIMYEALLDRKRYVALKRAIFKN